jgi:hypothetical protein
MDRDYILNHIEDFSAEQLFEFIKRDVVSLRQLQETGELDASKRTAIQIYLTKETEKDEKSWNIAKNQNTEVAYQDYLIKFSNGKYAVEAEKFLIDFKKTREEEEAEKKRILEALKLNPNAYPPSIIRKYLMDGSISESSLLEIGIPAEIISKIYQIDNQPVWELGKTPDSIPDGYTEVYFWGIRGSGKTTALAAVLSTANKLGYLEIAQGPGYDYMLQLQNLFNNEIATLPAASPVDNTQYLPFTLKKANERDYRSVSLIELSGEIFQCFLYKNANRQLPSPQHEDTFNTLLQFLKGKNRKLHFFFVDYDRANKVDQDRYTQANYLNAAATFFNNPEYNIFNNTADAIYIVTTKSDLMSGDNQSMVSQVSQYLNENNFTAFVNSLKAKCEKHSINNKRLLATPFSLGKVYFTEICEFDDTTAKNIIDIFMRRIPSSKNSVLDIFNK